MSHVTPLNDEEMGDALKFLQPTIKSLGFLPNSQRIMARKPELLEGINSLVKAILHKTDKSVSHGLLFLVGNAASLAAGCMYCVAHSGGAASDQGVEEKKLAAIWDFENSDLFSDAERAAIRFAQASATVPNMATSDDFVEMRKYYTDYQIIEMLSVISMYGFFNRWNDTLATGLEETPESFATKVLSQVGWEGGKHSKGSDKD